MIPLIHLSALAMLLGVIGPHAEEVLPYKDPTLPIEKRLDDLVARTSIDQKARALMDFAPPIDEGDVHIPGFDRGESLHGLAAPKHYAVTVWPSPICLGGAWDDQLIFEMGEMISEEARAQYHAGTKTRVGSTGPLVLYAPGVYLARDPRWGRYQECYSEDPYMVSRMTVGYVKGMQGDHPKYLKTACTTKCFVAYNKEYMRFGYDAKVSERWLREYYFKAHKACFDEANCRATMTAYNALNGVPCSGNKWLLTDVLRDEWGFTGFVMEDASATMAMAREDNRDKGKHNVVDTYKEASAMALNAGTDFMLCGVWRHHLEQAIKDGLTTEEKLNQAFRRVMRVRMELGEFDPREMSPWSHLTLDTLARPKHTAHARQAAQKGIVLLNNDEVEGAGKVLPINRDKVKKIAVVGPNARTRTLGIYSGNPKYQWTVLSGIQEAAGDGVEVIHVPWDEGRTEELVSGRSSSTVGLDGVPGWRVEYFNNRKFEGKPVYSTVVEHVFFRHADKLPEGITVPDYSIRWTADINPPETGKYRLNAFSDDWIRVTIDGKIVLNYPKEQWRIERRTDYDFRSDRNYDVVVEYANIGKVPTNIELFWERPASAAAVEYGEVEAAKRSDVVVAVLGLHHRDEGEGSTDRAFPNIAPDQIEMLRRVAKVNPNVVVVLINGSPLTLDTVTDLAPAIVEAWYPGQAAIAVADLIFGDVNPSGHLPSTMYKSWDQIKSIDDFEIHNGRTYMYVEGEVTYPFGHGLSYTEFEFSGLKLDKKELTPDAEMKVTVTVKNTGELTGSDVVQLYAREAKKVEGRPKRRLVAFERVEDLGPGEKRNVVLTVRARDLEYWDAPQKKLRVYPGTYILEAAETSEEIVETAEFSVQ